MVHVHYNIVFTLGQYRFIVTHIASWTSSIVPKFNWHSLTLDLDQVFIFNFGVSNLSLKIQRFVVEGHLGAWRVEFVERNVVLFHIVFEHLPEGTGFLNVAFEDAVALMSELQFNVH